MKKYILIPFILTIFGAILGMTVVPTGSKTISRNITIKARQYSYDPENIKVNIGDTLHIKLVSLDVFHGFYLEGYDIDAEIQANIKTFKIRHPSQGFIWKDTNEIVLITTKTGKYRYRCSHTCGTMHPFMQGELIVSPNNTLHAGLGGIIGFSIGMILMIIKKFKNSEAQ